MLEDDGRGGHLPRDLGLVAEACHGLPHDGLWSRHGAEPDPQSGRERSLGRVARGAAGDLLAVEDVDGQAAHDQEVDGHSGSGPDIIGHR